MHIKPPDTDFLRPFLDIRLYAEKNARQADRYDKDAAMALLHSALSYLGSALRPEHAMRDVKVTRKGNVIYPAMWSKTAQKATSNEKGV